MKIKHCTYAKEILFCYVTDICHLGNISNKCTINTNNRPYPSGCL